MINTQSVVHVIMFRHCGYTDLIAVAVVYRYTVQQRTGRSSASAAMASASATFRCGRRVGSLRCRTVSLRSLWRPLPRSVVWQRIALRTRAKMATKLHACMCLATLSDLKNPCFIRAMVFTVIDVAVNAVTCRCVLDAI